MKAAAAVMLLLFQGIAHQVPYPLGLQLTTDEESGGYSGTGYQIAQGIQSDFVISGELTDLAIGNKAKGFLIAKVTARGETAHSAYPWQGDNAIWTLLGFLQTVQAAFPIPRDESWVTTVNLARIETPNSSLNKVPDEASAFLEIRNVPEDSGTIEAKLRSLVPSGLLLEVLGNEPAHLTDPSHRDVVTLRQAIEHTTGAASHLLSKHGASDIRHYSKVGSTGVVFGPVGAGLHSNNEWIDVHSLELYYEVLREFARNLT